MNRSTTDPELAEIRTKIDQKITKNWANNWIGFDLKLVKNLLKVGKISTKFPQICPKNPPKFKLKLTENWLKIGRNWTKNGFHFPKIWWSTYQKLTRNSTKVEPKFKLKLKENRLKLIQKLTTNWSQIDQKLTKI